MRYTTGFGAFPEQVRPDGSLYKAWFGTAHGAFLMAVYRILMNLHGDCIKLAFALPDEWKNVSFKNIRLNNGLLASGEIKNKRINE